jgi:hypothetical protein
LHFCHKLVILATAMKAFTPIVLASLSFVGAASADIFDNFNDGNDIGWTRQNPLAPPVGQGATFSFPGGNTYQISAAASPNPVGLGPARAGSVRMDESYTDFFQRVDIVDWDETRTAMAMGFLARVQLLGLGQTTAYVCVLEADGDFYISRTVNEAPLTNFLVGDVSFNLDPAADYRMTFSGTGTTLSAQLYNLADDSTPISSLTVDDGTYTSGSSGIFIYDGAGTGTATAVFDNYGSAVPEPATAGILALGALVLANRRRRSC